MKEHTKQQSSSLIDLERAAAITGLSTRAINEVVLLRVIKPEAEVPGQGKLFSLDQTPVLEVVAAMNSLDFRLDQMRQMVTMLETIGQAPATPLAGHYRGRLAGFLADLSKRRCSTGGQQVARDTLYQVMQERYTW